MAKSIKNIAIQMDPISTININKDSSFALGLEAQKRGYKIYHYLADSLNWQGFDHEHNGQNGALTALAQETIFKRDPINFAICQDAARIDLANEIDVILMRQDPPFDLRYITATYFLEKIAKQTLIVNDPFWVRNCSEKIWVLDFPELIAPTMITKDQNELKLFAKKHKTIAIKPLYGNGGAGVFVMDDDDRNLETLFEIYADPLNPPFIAQKFIKNVSKGDKRIILVDGEALGAINRIPLAGKTRANFHVGGTPEKTELTDKEKEICAILKPYLQERGLIFVGIDIIDGLLTEINVTSPTGLQEITLFSGRDLSVDIWDAIEKKIAKL